MADDEQRPDGAKPATAAPISAAMSLDGDVDALRSYYATWAADYDRDVGDEEYGLPASVLHTIEAAAAVEPWLTDPEITVLDAGCGTGRVGLALAEHGYTIIDGVDLSPEMAALALARGVYRRVEAPVDLTEPPTTEWIHHADLVVVGGVFTVGHIPPSSLYDVAGYVRPGGVLVTTVRPGYWDTTDYAAVTEQFCHDGTADLLARFDALPYTADSHGLYFAYRINRPG